MIIRKWIQLFLYFMFLNDVIPIPNMNVTLKEDKFYLLSTILKKLFKCNKNIKKVVINCDANEYLIKSFSDLELVTISLHCNSSAVSPSRSRSQIGSFVAAFDSSVDRINEILHKFKKSPWWNVMTHFFVLSSSKNGCSDAEEVLKTVWKMNILKCYFVCFDFEQKPFVFTFNPYSKYAPGQWKIVQEIIEGSYVALYNRAYNEKNICKNLNFDRIKYLDKATLNLALCIPPTKVNSLPKLNEKNHHLIYWHFEKDMFKLFKKGLNISLNYNYDLEPFHELSKPVGVYKLLLNKTSDVAICTFSQQNVFKFHPSHQIIYTGTSIFSRNRGFRTPLEKMYNFYGPLMICGTVIISTITYFVIWYVNRLRGHWFAIFEILRLWTSTSVFTKIDTLALRIFFAVIFIYFLILQATFSGHLSKFLTNPELRDNAETLEDLQSNRYAKIYSTPSVTSLVVDDEILRPKSKPSTVFKSIDAVFEKESNAFVCVYSGILTMLKRMNVSKDYLKNYYLSKNFIKANYIVYAMRHDWPLHIKFDHFLILLEDIGILRKLNNDFISSLESLLLHIELNPKFKPIDVESLLFIFYFLGMGLSAATICFAFERRLGTKNKSRTGKRHQVQKKKKQKGRKNVIFV